MKKGSHGACPVVGHKVTPITGVKVVVNAGDMQVCKTCKKQFGKERVDNYTQQVDWERKCMLSCSVLAMWLPRKIPDMMGLTSNTEFGLYLLDNRFIYGRPDDAEHCRYQDWCYKKYVGRTPANSLELLMKEAEDMILIL